MGQTGDYGIISTGKPGESSGLIYGVKARVNMEAWETRLWVFNLVWFAMNGGGRDGYKKNESNGFIGYKKNEKTK